MGRPKTYSINEQYFRQNIDERQAYLLGLILSDGHLNYKRGRFQYTCRKDDIELIEFIKKTLKSTHPIKIKKNYAHYSISNIKLVQYLINNFNLPHSNKSINNLLIPKNIPANMISHFLRGVFDGDGSIWYGDTYRAGYTGGEIFLKEIQSILAKDGINSDFKYRYSKNNKNSCQITINGTFNVNKFKNLLYNDATFFLKRKKEKFDLCTNRADRLKNYYFKYNGMEEKIKQLYLDGNTQSKIAKQLGLVYSSVRACIQRLRQKSLII
jgi:intein/homing endonuclease